MGWIVFIGAAIVVFLYLQNPAPRTTAPPITGSTPPPISMMAIVTGWALTILGMVLLIWRGKVASRVADSRILDWGWNEEGIWLNDETVQESIPWLWIVGASRVRGGVLVASLGDTSFLIPKAAFDSPQQQTDFIDVASRNCVPTAKETNDAPGGRGFELRVG